MSAVSLFAGPGGGCEGLRMVGRDDVVGIELDGDACATRAAAGHRTIRADVATFPLPRSRVEGIVATPPCPTFSNAGKGEGVAELPWLHEHAHDCLTGWSPSKREWSDPRTPLVLEPLRWVDALVPDWIVLEQVPPVLPLWETFAHVWRALGWSVWTGVLNAADFGVPQTRRRAILMAHRRRPVTPPEPTHTSSGGASLFGELLPWISMAEALGWDGQDRPARTLAGNRSPRWMYPDRDGTHGVMVSDQMADGAAHTPWYDPSERPSRTVTSTPQRVRTRGERTTPGGNEFSTDQPSWALTEKARSWTLHRPATTVQGDPRVWPPGHKLNADDEARLGADEASERYGDRAGSEAIRLTIRDALILQSFPADYPVQGTKTAQFRQIGNAFPVVLAAAVFSALGVTA